MNWLTRFDRRRTPDTAPRTRGRAAAVRSIPLASCALFVVAALAGPAHAQNDPRLTELVREAQEGRSDSARVRAEKLLAATPSTDSLYPEILYTMGMIAGTTRDMQRHFQRVAVEYGGSAWADEALFRLAQLEYAGNNPAGVVRHLDRIRSDYPTSPLVGPAAYWAARAYFDTGDQAAACSWVNDGLERAGSDVELKQRLETYRARCASGAPAEARVAAAAPVDAPDGAPESVPALRPGDTAEAAAARTREQPAAAEPRAAPRTTPAAPSAASSSAYRVQVAAVSTAAAAEEIANRVRGFGYEAVVVQEGGYHKVRAGGYPSRDAAQRAARELKAKLGGSPFVVPGR